YKCGYLLKRRKVLAVPDVKSGAAQVYGMIAGAEEDAAGSATGDATEDVADDVSNAAAEFALMGISSQVHTCS
ncbi:hypothetical protein Tco_0284373, partial [Tanacetum coccineum]